MIYRKYSFTKELDYDKKIKGLKNFTAIPVTCVKTPAVIKEGKVITEAVIDPNYNVDVIWEQEEPPEFIPVQVWPHNIGQHIVGGWEEQYAIDREKALEAATLPEPKTKKSKLK